MAVQKTDEELFAELKKLENWQDYPLPENWYEKFNIPKPEAVDTATYIKENKWMKSWVAGGKSITIIKEPQEYKENTPRGFVETEPLEMKVIQTQGNYSDENPILTRQIVSYTQPDSCQDSETDPKAETLTNNLPE